MCQDNTLCCALGSPGSRLRDGDLHTGSLLGSVFGNKTCPVGACKDAGLDRRRGRALVPAQHSLSSPH